jgi:hypothetical protein
MDVQNPEFYADFRSEELFRKNAPKKVKLDNIFSGDLGG